MASVLQLDGFASGSFHKQGRTPRLWQILNMLLFTEDANGRDELNYAGPAWRVHPPPPQPSHWMSRTNHVAKGCLSPRSCLTSPPLFWGRKGHPLAAIRFRERGALGDPNTLQAGIDQSAHLEAQKRHFLL